MCVCVSVSVLNDLTNVSLCSASNYVFSYKFTFSPAFFFKSTSSKLYLFHHNCYPVLCILTIILFVVNFISVSEYFKDFTNTGERTPVVLN